MSANNQCRPLAQEELLQTAQFEADFFAIGEIECEELGDIEADVEMDLQASRVRAAGEFDG